MKGIYMAAPEMHSINDMLEAVKEIWQKIEKLETQK